MASNGSQNGVEKRSYEPPPAPSVAQPAPVQVPARAIQIQFAQSLDPRQSRYLVHFVRGDQAHVEVFTIDDLVGFVKAATQVLQQTGAQIR